MLYREMCFEIELESLYVVALKPIIKFIQPVTVIAKNSMGY